MSTQENLATQIYPSGYDQILQQACPTIMVPRFGELQPLTKPGHRFLVATDGLWMELHRPWLHIIWPIARQHRVAIPYGALKPTIRFAFDTIPGELIKNFIDDARYALPNEFAAWFLWNSQSEQFSYRPLLAMSSGPTHLEIKRPILSEHEHLVVDIHSHGRLPAGFSREDNCDDAGEVKISVVIGNLGEGQRRSSKLRLCANGLSIPPEYFVDQGLCFGDSH